MRDERTSTQQPGSEAARQVCGAGGLLQQQLRSRQPFASCEEEGREKRLQRKHTEPNKIHCRKQLELILRDVYRLFSIYTKIISVKENKHNKG